MTNGKERVKRRVVSKTTTENACMKLKRINLLRQTKDSEYLCSEWLCNAALIQRAVSSRQLAYLSLHCAPCTWHVNIPVSRQVRPTPIRSNAPQASIAASILGEAHLPSYHHLSPPVCLAIRVTITLPITSINALTHLKPPKRSISIPAPAAQRLPFLSPLISPLNAHPCPLSLPPS